MSVYLDTSVLIPLFIDDAFSVQAETLVRDAGSTLVIGDFLRAEFASVVGRIVHTGKLPESGARQIFADFDHWSGPFLPAETTAQDVRRTETWLRQLVFNLRAPDALHIAIAARLGARLATFDVRMAEAAEALGVAVEKA